MVRLAKGYRIPAHMRNLQARCLNPAHHPLENSQAFGLWRFLTSLKENLLTYANSQQRGTLGNAFPNSWNQPCCLQIAHAFSKISNSRQYQLICFGNQFLITSN